MQTKNIRVGHGIVVCVPQFNHPIRVAERAAVLDILSDGRLEFGTGRSATWTELGGMDANPDETKETWDEYVRTIPQMWTNEPLRLRGPRLQDALASRAAQALPEAGTRRCGSRCPAPAPRLTPPSAASVRSA